MCVYVCVSLCVCAATMLSVSVEAGRWADLAQAGGGGMWVGVAGFNVPT